MGGEGHQNPFKYVVFLFGFLLASLKVVGFLFRHPRPKKGFQTQACPKSSGVHVGYRDTFCWKVTPQLLLQQCNQDRKTVLGAGAGFGEWAAHMAESPGRCVWPFCFWASRHGNVNFRLIRRTRETPKHRSLQFPIDSSSPLSSEVWCSWGLNPWFLERLNGKLPPKPRTTNPIHSCWRVPFLLDGLRGPKG